ncbi:MAG: di-trans,poly-cis-decaprenylcistransferase [Elusimicrobia bacterium]|nr:di-trans,poly-cis-decaprenylcistransferase [Elusimicrobiota bacterium]
MKNPPRHIAIVMDGNGRWAKKRNLPRIKGHIAGAKCAKKITTFCRKEGIKFLTLYAFSTENWKRSEKEISFLFSLLENYIKKEDKNLIKNEIRFRTIGDISKIPPKISAKLKTLEKKTGNCRQMTLIIALNYGSRDEIIRAVKKLLRKKHVENIRREFENCLDTSGIPDPDLIIRTSGETRLSNFLLWQGAYSELYFTKTLWPDFGENEMMRAINSFKRRKRRFGGY